MMSMRGDCPGARRPAPTPAEAARTANTRVRRLRVIRESRQGAGFAVLERQAGGFSLLLGVWAWLAFPALLLRLKYMYMYHYFGSLRVQ